MVDLQLMPKLDLHCHLEGAFRTTTLYALYQQQSSFKDNGFADFKGRVSLGGQSASTDVWFEKFFMSVKAITKQEHLVQLTTDCIEDAYQDGIIYREIRYAPYFIHDLTGLAIEAIIEAVIEGNRQGQEKFPVKTELILIAQQPDGLAKAEHIVQLAHRYQHVGVDIASLINEPPLEIYRPAMQKAKELGLHITIHAGEFQGADSVRTALIDLGAERIGHGIRSVENEAVLQMVKQENSHLEVNVSSNIQTQVVASLAEHPISRLIAEGVNLSINTDDPTLQGITLTHEYDVLLKAGIVTVEQLKQCNHNAVSAAFTDKQTKTALRQQLEG